MAVVLRPVHQSPLQSFPNHFGSRMSACSGKDQYHVQSIDASKPESLLETVTSPFFSTMEASSKRKILDALSKSLSPTICIQVRSAARKNALNDLAARCDLYIDSKLPDMLAREDVLSLPRIQVNIKLSSDVFEMSSDSNIIEELVPKVVQTLEENCAAHLEERVLEMHLMSDYSLSLDKSNSKFTNTLSPEKPEGIQRLREIKPSPARKLILGSTSDSEDEEMDLDYDKWKIISTHKMSELSAVCVVDNACDLVLVNVALIPPNATNKDLPVSPTTGLPFLNGVNLIAQMGIARSGFGAVSLDDTLLSVGGFNRDGCVATTERYNLKLNCWEDVCDLNTKRARFGTAALGKTVFAIGGSDGRNELASVEMYNSDSQTWRLHESRLITPRSCFGATSLNDRIYAIGGLYYSTPLKSAEMFNPTTNRWESLPSMYISRRDVAVTSCSGKVYAIGGQTSGWSCLASVESFDPTTRKWTKAPSMQTPRRNATAVTVDNKVYVIGGYNGSSAVRHVEVFDPAANTWTQSSQLNVKRSYASATLINQSIYVVGGYSSSSFLNSMERLDLSTNQWTSFV